MERDLLLFRHGPAEERRPGLTDHERALTADGRRATRTAVRGLARLLDTAPLIITSPARRARETADLLVAGWDGARLTSDARLALGASPQQMRACVLEQDTAAPIVLVGHEPDLSGFLAASLDAPAGARFKLGKAGVAWLRCTEALDQPAMLRLLLSRRALGGLAA
jgi:phosphohistidine phosphatase